MSRPTCLEGGARKGHGAGADFSQGKLFANLLGGHLFQGAGKGTTPGWGPPAGVKPQPCAMLT